MEFTIEKDAFVRALQKIQGIVERRNTMPILSNVLIEALDDSLTLTATDLEVGMKSRYQAKVYANGKITISAKKLYEIIRELPDEQIKFSTRDNDWVDISCGKAKFNIVGLSPDEFPSFPKIDEKGFISLDSVTLARMIEQTSYSICHDETKYNLNGILFKVSDENDERLLRLVATDGHRLCVAEQVIESSSFDILDKGVIFPKKGIFELKKLCDEEISDIKLGFIDNSVAIVKGNTTVVMRLVDGEFPDYKRVVPVGNDKEIIIGKELFLHSLKRMAILSSEKFKGIKFEITNNFMEISSSNPELGEAREELEVKYSGDKITTRFNARYLIDVLNVVTSDDITLLLKDEMSPAILKQADSDNFLSVIMPMRL
ncbi:MAG: polymerase beta subunit [Deltaproteobacteria bacterium]|nr:polymerase beta subunit [Deltaproteobacteria bacterium]